MPRKFLVVRFSSIGDIVLTTPVIRGLREQTGAEIHYLTKSSFRSILEHNPHLSRVWTIDKKLEEVAAELRAERFDAVVDLHNNLRTRKLSWHLRGVKTHRFPKLNLRKWLLTRLKIDRMPDVHIVDRYLSAVRPLGVENDGKGLEYFTGPVNVERPNASGVQLKDWTCQPYLAFVVGAAHFTKCLTETQMADFCRSYAGRILLLGGPAEAALGERLTTTGDHVINGCGRTTLNESAYLVSRAAAVLTHDTGLMHVAAAFRRPIVSVWGNTVPAFGMYPYLPGQEDRERKRRIEIEDLDCRPCSKIGHPECPRGHFRCIRDIEVVDIITKVKDLGVV